ncbi:hypothetical protein EVAR_65043_1 [Eumeta japonica]|uniref:Uncharacterized protein n=1 Tax=Eumeta variegata TaxID=151549 RepID=A0A4C1ZRU1_EUMVA|nr:hypothetical protein EVAR_65043_1 [Eumeta japonica]
MFYGISLWDDIAGRMVVSFHKMKVFRGWRNLEQGPASRVRGKILFFVYNHVLGSLSEGVVSYNSSMKQKIPITELRAFVCTTTSFANGGEIRYLCRVLIQKVRPGGAVPGEASHDCSRIKTSSRHNFRVEPSKLEVSPLDLWIKMLFVTCSGRHDAGFRSPNSTWWMQVKCDVKTVVSRASADPLQMTQSWTTPASRPMIRKTERLVSFVYALYDFIKRPPSLKCTVCGCLWFIDDYLESNNGS